MYFIVAFMAFIGVRGTSIKIKIHTVCIELIVAFMAFVALDIKIICFEPLLK